MENLIDSHLSVFRGNAKLRHNSPKKRKRRKKYRSQSCIVKKSSPFNSNTFLMDQYDHINDELLEHINSHSSPTDYMEEDFRTTFQDYPILDRGPTPVYDLVQELIQEEENIENLQSELQVWHAKDRERIREPSPSIEDDDEEHVPGEVPVDDETAIKIESFIKVIKIEEERKEAIEKDIKLYDRELKRILEPVKRSYESSSEDDIIEPVKRTFEVSSSSEEEIVKIKPVLENRIQVKPLPDSSVDSGLASLEGNTSESSEDYRELCDKRL